MEYDDWATDKHAEPKGTTMPLRLAEPGAVIWRGSEPHVVSPWHKTTYVRRGRVGHANERKFIRNKQLRFCGFSRAVVGAGPFWLAKGVV